MRRFLKRAFALTSGAVIASALLSGCSGSSSKSSSSGCDTGDLKVVGYSPYVNTGGYFPFVERGMAGALDKCGVKVNTSDPNADASKQVSGLENLIAAGATYVVVCPTDPAAVEPVAQRLASRGVTVIGLATNLKAAKVTFNLDDTAFGKLEGASAGRWLKARNSAAIPKIAILHQDSGGAPLIARHKGITDGLDETLGANKYKVVSDVEAYQEDTGNDAVSTILQAHPDINMIVGMNDASALGALSAVRSAGLKPGTDVGIVTGGEDKRVLTAVLSKQIVSTVGLFPMSQGKIIGNVIIKLAGGQKVAREQIVPAKLVTSGEAQGILDSLK